jgi:heme exporter protein D
MIDEYSFYILAAYGLAIVLLMGLYSTTIVQLRTLRDRLDDEG